MTNYDGEAKKTSPKGSSDAVASAPKDYAIAISNSLKVCIPSHCVRVDFPMMPIIPCTESFIDFRTSLRSVSDIAIASSAMATNADRWNPARCARIESNVHGHADCGTDFSNASPRLYEKSTQKVTVPANSDPEGIVYNSLTADLMAVTNSGDCTMVVVDFIYRVYTENRRCQIMWSIFQRFYYRTLGAMTNYDTDEL